MTFKAPNKMNTPLVSYRLNDNIGVIRVFNPPVNAMSQGVREGIKQCIERASADTSRAIVLLCEGRTFIAGADIREFDLPPVAPSLPEVLDCIEQCPKPVIAALHGTALGGGFELALACHYRCALTSAKVGLPEVKLGLLPGAGGTQRVPRLAGLEAALELISSGSPVSAVKAERLGLVDRLYEDDLDDHAIVYARELVEQHAVPKRIRDITIDPGSVAPDFFDMARKNLSKRLRGQPAAQHIVTCLEAAVNLPFEQGLEKERSLFLECKHSDVSAAMRHLFFAERAAAKVEGLAKETIKRSVHTVAVIGGGTMGGGIAMNFANIGVPVTLIELDEDAIGRSLAVIEKNYDISVSKGKFDKAHKKRCMNLIRGTTEYDEIADVDLVIEAVFENLELKKTVFTRLDEACKPGAILATNTSYQDIDQIASATRRPADVVGMHFFSPANVMKLLEVVRGKQSADDVIATAVEIGKTIDKIPVVAGNCYGFIGNRMLEHYFRETQLCLIEGASPEQIDGVMEEFGMAMGPLAVGDLAGLDVGYKARQALSDQAKGDPKTYCIADALVEMGRLGQKTGDGYYNYDPNTRARSSDSTVMELVEQQAKKQGVKRRHINDGEIRERLLFALINEGARLLEDGIAQRASDIDVVYVYGYGFPKYRGGPMFYADCLGLDTVLNAISAFSQTLDSDYWTPAPLIVELAERGGAFSENAKTVG